MAQLEQKDEKKEATQNTTKILIIDKGFGNAKQRMKQLRSTFADKNIVTVELTEPSEKSKYDASVRKLEAEMLEFRPNVIIASSRGGRYAASLLNSENKEVAAYIKGHCGVLLLSAMDTLRCCMSNAPILLYHAQNDGINAIESVRAHCASYPLSQLIVAEKDSHSLESIKGDDNLKLCELVTESARWFEHCQSKENRDKLLQKVDGKQQKKVRNRFDLLAQIKKK